MGIKQIVKTVMPWAPTGYHAGKRVCRIMQNKLDAPLIVLLYHRVADLESDPQMLAVTPQNFAEQMKYLKENYDILRLEEEWGKLARSSIMITFDDGYVDNYINALPILEKYEIPATIFVATGNIDTDKEFWWDDLERIILLNDHLPRQYKLESTHGCIEMDFTNTKMIRHSYDCLHPFVKAMQADERDAVIEKLCLDLTPNVGYREAYRTMTTEELKKIDSSPYINIGGHTVSHTQLSIQSSEKQLEEISVSKQVLEKILCHNLTTFSYPFGCRSDYNQYSIEAVRSVGYDKAASNYAGQIHSTGADKYEYPRQIVRNWSVDEFKKHLHDFWTNY